MFIQNVYKQSKYLAIAFILFIIGQIFFTYKEVENTPFMMWAMYSQKYDLNNGFDKIEIKIDDQYWDYSKEALHSFELITITANHYYLLKTDTTYNATQLSIIRKELPEALIKAGKFEEINTVSKLNSYPAWIKHYLEMKVGHPIKHLEIFKSHINRQSKIESQELIIEL